MALYEEARRGGDLERAPEGVILAGDTTENSRNLLQHQAAWISRRLGISLDRALTLAGLAFDQGRPA